MLEMLVCILIQPIKVYESQTKAHMESRKENNTYVSQHIGESLILGIPRNMIFLPT